MEDANQRDIKAAAQAFLLVAAQESKYPEDLKAWELIKFVAAIQNNN